MYMPGERIPKKVFVGHMEKKASSKPQMRWRVAQRMLSVTGWKGAAKNQDGWKRKFEGVRA